MSKYRVKNDHSQNSKGVGETPSVSAQAKIAIKCKSKTPKATLEFDDNPLDTQFDKVTLSSDTSESDSQTTTSTKRDKAPGSSSSSIPSTVLGPLDYSWDRFALENVFLTQIEDSMIPLLCHISSTGAVYYNYHPSNFTEGLNIDIQYSQQFPDIYGHAPLSPSSPPLSLAGSSSPTTPEYYLDQAYVPDTTVNNNSPLTNSEFNYLTDLLDPIQITQDMSYPLLATAFTDPSESHLRSLLHGIVKSDWFCSNNFETKTEKGRSVFFSFLAHDGSGAYRCLFKECNKNIDRQDRALGHIRMHLGHRPHACDGKCGVIGCLERFYCASYLRSHTKRQKEPCGICQESFFRQHLRKHRLVCQGTQHNIAIQRTSDRFFAYLNSTA